MTIIDLYKILFKYVADGSEKIPSAMQMRGIYHDMGKLVACNTHTLFVVNAGLSYSPEKEGRVLSKNLEILDTSDAMGTILPYPDYKKVIQAIISDAKLILSKSECNGFIKACRTIRASNDTANQVYVRVMDLVIVDPKIIVDIANIFDLLKESFDVLIYTEKDKQFKPIVFASENSTVVTMPFDNTSYVVSVEDALNVGDLL